MAQSGCPSLGHQLRSPRFAQLQRLSQPQTDQDSPRIALTNRKSLTFPKWVRLIETLNYHTS